MVIKVGDRVAIYAGDRKTGKVVEVFPNQTCRVSLDLYPSVPTYHIKQLRLIKSSIYYYMWQDLRGYLHVSLSKEQARNLCPPGRNLIVLKKVKEI